MTEAYRMPIDGMTCQACVARITGAVRKVAGVATVRADLASASTIVAIDPS